MFFLDNKWQTSVSWLSSLLPSQGSFTVTFSFIFMFRIFSVITSWANLSFYQHQLTLRCAPEGSFLNGSIFANPFLKPIYKISSETKGTKDQTQLWRPQCPQQCCKFHKANIMWYKDVKAKLSYKTGHLSLGWNHFRLCFVLRICSSTQSVTLLYDYCISHIPGKR